MKSPMALKVLTFNTSAWTDAELTTYLPRLAAFLRDVDADFVFLSELLHEANITARVGELAGYPFTGEEPSYPHHTPQLAVGFVSKRPPQAVVTIPVFRCRQGWHNALRVSIPVDSELWTIYGVHFWNMDQIGRSVPQIALTELLHDNPRIHQARQILFDIRQLSGPAVLLGDLNTFPLSRAYRLLSSGLRDSCPSAKSFRGTYTGGALRPRLDYVWHTRGLRSTGYAVIDPELSDHRAVLCRLEVG